jgi:membrane protein YqaA with SNARE-associated domain
MSRLSDIFIESLVHRLLPMQPEITLPAMQAFGQPPAIALVAAAAGALIASVALYGIGVWLRRMPKKISTEAQQARIEKLRAVAVEWLPWLLILAPSPVGGMLIIAAGFFAIRPWRVALAVMAGEAAWRLSPYL